MAFGVSQADALLIDGARLDAAHMASSSLQFSLQLSVLPHQEIGFPLLDAKDKTKRAEIAILQPTLPPLHPRQEVRHQRSLIGVTFLAKQQML